MNFKNVVFKLSIEIQLCLNCFVLHLQYEDGWVLHIWMRPWDKNTNPAYKEAKVGDDKHLAMVTV